MDEVLYVIATEMNKLGINYDFMTWKISPVPYPYCVGQYFITGHSAENNGTNVEFWLEAWDRNLSYENLVEIDKKVMKHFSDLKIYQNGVAMAISYLTSSLEREEDGELKKLQMKLDITYWEGE